MSADIREFGKLADGRVVRATTLRAGELSARILTLGATLQDLRLAGTPWPLVLGSDLPGAYMSSLNWCGAVVGPVANRIGGARARIDGRDHRFTPNEGPNLLHSGDDGISGLIWELTEAAGDAVTLQCDLAHGFGGFPGHRMIRVTYRIASPATLEITLSAQSDRETLMNLAHHPYWNLDGTGTTSGHSLSVAASRVLPTRESLPLGPVPVEGTPYDLRQARALPDLPPLDHNYCLDAADTPRPVARLTGERGVTLVLETDAPGLQVYDGRGLDSTPYPGLTGQPYKARAGLALEPQLWPDAPNHPDFPSIALRPGQEWRQKTRYTLSRA
ncbi:aldose epimerase family protein [Sedimentimonas flavescens]|uniref:aldose epimerase family protein n=1 Tax=Sedimentimonas flavescens TaxID=2851012 RepID=UPI001C4A0A4F|nr:aldose epimerase family protein [Sedimentimonas flavescens]MBW0158345.1 galactose mutarotase [Sedimentimonas flavescens]